MFEIGKEAAGKPLPEGASTQRANLCGLKAMSVSWPWNSDKLPRGAHFITPAGKEAGPLRMVGQLEKAKL